MHEHAYSILCFMVAFLLSLLLTSCGQAGQEEAAASDATTVDPLTMPLADEHLSAGRKTWAATCAQCHLRGIGGAPIIGDKAAWKARIAKGKETLYDHAINGFSGPSMNEMPAKGGFMELSDAEVRQAVDFVVHASQ